SFSNVATVDITVTFDVLAFVKRLSDALTGSFIQPLYSTAAASDTIQLRSVTITENPQFDRDITVALNGGYDVGFANAAGVTVIKGEMTIRNGTVQVSNVKIN